MRHCGYKGIYLITLSHKPAGYILFLPCVSVAPGESTQHSLDDQGSCAELHCSLHGLALCEDQVKKKLYKMTSRDTVSVQNNSQMSDRIKAPLSYQLERREPYFSQLNLCHVFVTATLHFYIDGEPLLGTVTSPMSPRELFGVGKRLFL